MNEPTETTAEEATKPEKTPVEWKSKDEESIDPFGIVEEDAKAKPIVCPPPTRELSEKEKNAIQKELLAEIEGKAISYHESIQFYERDEFTRSDLAQYSDEGAKAILESKSQLNAEQIAAAMMSRRDLNIKALAGTGKTSLLSASISYLIATGVAPERIAISSHTVTAAAEIEGRIGPTLESLFPEALAAMGNKRPKTGTIHAIAYREMITHKHPKGRWTILDEPNQFRVWKEASMFADPENAGRDLDNQTGEEMRLVDRVRGYDVAETRVPEILGLLNGPESGLEKTAAIYQKIKEARKLLDYTDLLREWAPIIIQPGYRAKWEYFFVDEFQDTSPLQKFLLKLLKFQGAKLVVCGDNRQSINSFTGSDPTSHEAFFEECAIPEAWLETNYRCSREIIALANRIIGSMSPPEKGRLQAGPKAPEGTPARIVFTRAENDTRTFLPPKEAEAEKRRECEISCQEAVALYEELTEENKDPQNVAVLYRTNAQGGALEETMAAINGRRKDKGLEPIVYVRKDFRRTALRNKTEREVIAILKCWAAPWDTHWSPLLLSPYFHGIGEVTATTIEKKADRAKPKNMEECQELFDGEVNRKNAETVGEFFDAWDTARSKDPDEEPDASLAIKATEAWIAKTSARKNVAGNAKKENEEAQRRSYEAGIFERVKDKRKIGKLSAILQEIEEENEKAAQTQNNANKALGLQMQGVQAEKETGLILSTIHLAKGREYDGVVIHQVSRGSLPHFNALRFYENPKNALEKSFRKYASFPSLQKEGSSIASDSLPPVWRTGIPDGNPKNKIEEWEDHNNPLEEEKRLLYVAVTRAKRRLVITSKDHNYQFLPKELWENLKKGRKLRS